VASVFNDLGNIYESYNMTGGRGGDTGGNYLEHCGGFAWTVAEGAFGIDFGSDTEAAATITPRFDPSWPSASADFRLRGVDILLEYDGSSVTLKRKTAPAQQQGDAQASATVRVRLVWGGKTNIVSL
jgi:hypothetical protein